MKYTKEQKNSIEKIINVFDDYIKKSPDFDLLWSEKVGFLFYPCLSENMDRFDGEPIYIEDGNELCNELITEMAQDAMLATGSLHDFSECSAEERAYIEQTLAPYLEQLPEYAYLLSDLFEE